MDKSGRTEEKKWMLMSQNKQQKNKCPRSDEVNEVLNSITLRRTRKKKKKKKTRDRDII
jgi:hypothetical protein